MAVSCTTIITFYRLKHRKERSKIIVHEQIKHDLERLDVQPLVNPDETTSFNVSIIVVISDQANKLFVSSVEQKLTLMNVDHYAIDVVWGMEDNLRVFDSEQIGPSPLLLNSPEDLSV